MKQRTSIWMVPAAALLAISPQLVLAQASMSASAPSTRAEVKVETKRANAAGEIVKDEIGVSKAAQTVPSSTTTRTEVKAETKRANAAGEIVKDEVGLSKAGQAVPPSKESRVDVKADAKAAVKSGNATKPAATKTDPKKDPQQ
ncbi:MAG: hypothetical protein H7Y33_11055 [Cytophagales bacterium]|nr:hypothetical protein [Rhizobacter sp.]